MARDTLPARRPATAPAAPAPTAGGTNALALMASRLQVAPAELQRCLIDTAFKGATEAEFIALVAVANQYGLNPLVREIYAFSKTGGGIVPLVPIDGWLKLIRRDPDFAGMETRWSDELVQPSSKAKDCPAWCEVTIHHKSHPEYPTEHREWIDEMYRDTGPWNTTTKRMLEWKAIIQCGRKAFGLTGIFDQDEAERIAAGEMVTVEATATTAPAPIGEEAYLKLVAQAQRFGYSVADVQATAATEGYEGPGEKMPEDLAQRIYQGMKANPCEAEQPAAGGYRTPMTGGDGQ
jgi:phage recombination protein Bet